VSCLQAVVSCQSHISVSHWFGSVGIYCLRLRASSQMFSSNLEVVRLLKIMLTHACEHGISSQYCLLFTVSVVPRVCM